MATLPNTHRWVTLDEVDNIPPDQLFWFNDFMNRSIPDRLAINKTKPRGFVGSLVKGVYGYCTPVVDTNLQALRDRVAALQAVLDTGLVYAPLDRNTDTIKDGDLFLNNHDEHRRIPATPYNTEHGAPVNQHDVSGEYTYYRIVSQPKPIPR